MNDEFLYDIVILDAIVLEAFVAAIAKNTLSVNNIRSIDHYAKSKVKLATGNYYYYEGWFFITTIGSISSHYFSAVHGSSRFYDRAGHVAINWKRIWCIY
jgi:hypothetical protein